MSGEKFLTSSSKYPMFSLVAADCNSSFIFQLITGQELKGTEAE